MQDRATALQLANPVDNILQSWLLVLSAQVPEVPEHSLKSVRLNQVVSSTKYVEAWTALRVAKVTAPAMHESWAPWRKYEGRAHWPPKTPTTFSKKLAQTPSINLFTKMPLQPPFLAQKKVLRGTCSALFGAWCRIQLKGTEIWRNTSIIIFHSSFHPTVLPHVELFWQPTQTRVPDSLEGNWKSPFKRPYSLSGT